MKGLGDRWNLDLRPFSLPVLISDFQTGWFNHGSWAFTSLFRGLTLANSKALYPATSCPM